MDWIIIHLQIDVFSFVFSWNCILICFISNYAGRIHFYKFMIDLIRIYYLLLMIGAIGDFFFPIASIGIFSDLDSNCNLSSHKESYKYMKFLAVKFPLIRMYLINEFHRCFYFSLRSWTLAIQGLLWNPQCFENWPNRSFTIPYEYSVRDSSSMVFILSVTRFLGTHPIVSKLTIRIASSRFMI